MNLPDQGLQLGWTGKTAAQRVARQTPFHALEPVSQHGAPGSGNLLVQIFPLSGPAQFAVVSRLKQGLKEKTPGFRKPFKATYEGIFGEDALDDHIQNIREYTNEVWSEMLFLRKDLSSK